MRDRGAFIHKPTFTIYIIAIVLYASLVIARTARPYALPTTLAFMSVPYALCPRPRTYHHPASHPPPAPYPYTFVAFSSFCLFVTTTFCLAAVAARRPIDTTQLNVKQCNAYDSVPVLNELSIALLIHGVLCVNRFMK